MGWRWYGWDVWTLFKHGICKHMRKKENTTLWYGKKVKLRDISGKICVDLSMCESIMVKWSYRKVDVTYQSTSDRRCTPLRHHNNKGDMYIIALQESRMNTRIMDGHARENIYYIRACIIKHVHPYIYNIEVVMPLRHRKQSNYESWADEG